MVDRDSVFKSDARELDFSQWHHLQPEDVDAHFLGEDDSHVASGLPEAGRLIDFALIEKRRAESTYLIVQPQPACPETSLPTCGYALKRAIDIGGSLALLVFFAPIMAVVAMLVRVFDGGPVLFRQERIGEGGRSFTIFKFRSMQCGADGELTTVLSSDTDLGSEWATRQKLTRDPRVTRLGRLLRTSSLDELPQLYNVLIGDMSLVGPRPIVPNESKRYGRYFAHYRTTRPGLTGLWQVSGRNGTTYRRRVALDVAYSRRASLGLDVKILLMTVPAVITAKGY
ncbi:MAG: sugar transferase [Novosphingobium sp.]